MSTTDQDGKSGFLPKFSAKSKKTEILSAYEELRNKLEQNVETASERKSDFESMHQAEILKTAASYTAETIMGSINQLEGNVGKWLRQLVESLTAEVNKLQTVKEALTIQEKQLENIHAIKAEADTLADLIQVHKDKKRQLEEEYERDVQELAKAIEAKKELWQREQETYDYELSLKRKKEEAVWQEKKLAREKELQERQEKLNTLEDELVELRAFKDEAEAKLATALDKMKKDTEMWVRKEEEVKAKILSEHMLAEKRVSELTVSSLQQRLTEQDKEIARLKSDLQIANREAKDIAVKVIEGHSRMSEEHRRVREEEGKRGKEERVGV